MRTNKLNDYSHRRVFNNKLSDSSFKFVRSAHPNEFMHQNQNHKQSNYFDLVDGLGRPSDIIQNLILMHKLIRIHSVFFTYVRSLVNRRRPC